MSLRRGTTGFPRGNLPLTSPLLWHVHQAGFSARGGQCKGHMDYKQDTIGSTILQVGYEKHTRIMFFVLEWVLPGSNRREKCQAEMNAAPLRPQAAPRPLRKIYRSDCCVGRWRTEVDFVERFARWSAAEGRLTEPAGPRPGALSGGLVHERQGFRPQKLILKLPLKLLGPEMLNSQKVGPNIWP